MHSTEHALSQPPLVVTRLPGAMTKPAARRSIVTEPAVLYAPAQAIPATNVTLSRICDSSQLLGAACQKESPAVCVVST